MNYYSSYTRRKFFQSLIIYLCTPFVVYIYFVFVKGVSVKLSLLNILYFLAYYLVYALIVVLFQYRKIYSFDINEESVSKVYPFRNKKKVIEVKEIKVVEFHINYKRGVYNHIIFYNEEEAIGKLEVFYEKDFISSLKLLNQLNIPVFIRKHIKEVASKRILKLLNDNKIVFDTKEQQTYEQKYREYHQISYWKNVFDD